jgi:hypothetical protein
MKNDMPLNLSDYENEVIESIKLGFETLSETFLIIFLIYFLIKIIFYILDRFYFWKKEEEYYDEHEIL